MKLFLDMDGVLVNWCKGAHKLHNIPLDDGNWPYKRGPEGWNWNRELGMSTSELFADQGREFWANLDWMPDGKEILEVCEYHFGRENICLLTNPWNANGVIDGRFDWVLKNMPDYYDRILVGACKEMCASPESLLVDDYDANIDNWEDSNGVGFLLPRPWNSREHVKNKAVDLLVNFIKDMPV